MTALGIFAGRGDVVLAMGLAILVGVWIGYQAKTLCVKYVEWKRKEQV